MSDETVLPEGFQALEPFVERWAVSGTARRAALRNASSPEEREAFFAAAGPMAARALDHLDGCALDMLPASEERLMNLMLTLAHIGIAVEIQGPDEPKLAPWRERMILTRSPAGI